MAGLDLTEDFERVMCDAYYFLCGLGVQLFSPGSFLKPLQLEFVSIAELLFLAPVLSLPKPGLVLTPMLRFNNCRAAGVSASVLLGVLDGGSIPPRPGVFSTFPNPVPRADLSAAERKAAPSSDAFNRGV